MNAPRKRAFVIAGVKIVKGRGHDQRQHAVAEEFQPLVGARGIGAGMGERTIEKFAVLEGVAEFFFEGFGQGASAPG